jgi:hypothetical protein
VTFASRARFRRALRFAPATVVAGSIVAFLYAAAAASQPAVADRESQVKAAYVYKFLRYVKWPEGNRPPSVLRIGVEADGALLDALRALDGRVVDDVPISVHPLAHPDDASDCSVVVIGAGATHTEALLSKLAAAGEPVLTIGDEDPQRRQATMITFLRVGRNVAFGVELAPAHAVGIGFSAHLLQNAEFVRDSASTTESR